MTESAIIEDVGCEQCGRKLGQMTISCPERARNRCVYHKKNLVSKGKRIGGIAYALFGALLLLAFIAIIREGLKGSRQLTNSLPFLLLFIAVAALPMFIGMFTAIHQKVLLFNAESNIICRLTMLLMLEWEREIFTRAELVIPEVDHPFSLTLPASLVQYSTGDRNYLEKAVDIVKATLLNLAAQGLVTISLHKTYKSRFGGRVNRFVFVAVAPAAVDAKGVTINGNLEQKIVSVLSKWTDQVRFDEWPIRASVFRLVLALFAENIQSPERWIIDLVATDAASRGLSAIDSSLARQQEYVAEVSVKLTQNHPEFSRQLEDQIRSGLLPPAPPAPDRWTYNGHRHI